MRNSTAGALGLLLCIMGCGDDGDQTFGGSSTSTSTSSSTGGPETTSTTTGAPTTTMTATAGSGDTGTTGPGGDRPNGDPCTDATQCAGGVCGLEEWTGYAGGICTSPCDAQTACEADETCAILANVAGGSCLATCTADPDCGDNQRCVMVSPTTSICDSVCGGPADCVSGMCQNNRCIGTETCGDGFDNDLDGRGDCTDTDDCGTDNQCTSLITAACQAATVAALGANMGDTSGGTNLAADSCTGGVAPDDFYVFTPMAGGTYTISVDSVLDLGFHIRTDCEDELTSVNCTDGAGAGMQEVATLPLIGGTDYYIIIDAFEFQQGGAYTLDIALN